MTAITRRRMLLAAAGTLAGVPLARAAAHGPESESEAFLRAVREGDAERVDAMLAADSGLAASADGEGRTALVLAFLAGERGIAARLLAEELELDVVESALAEDWERFERLAAADRAGLDAAHPIGGTVLWGAARTGTPELYRLRYEGCDPDGNPPGSSGLTPARAAVDCPDAVGAYVTLVDLLGNGSDPNAPQRGGDSVLHAAVRRRDERLVGLALRKHADPDARDARGRTPLGLARELEWGPGVRLLEGQAGVARDHRSSRYAYDWNREPVRPLDLADVPRMRQSLVTGSSHAKLEVVRGLLAEDPRLVWSVSADAELAIEACGHTGNRAIIRLHLDHGAPLSLPTALSLGELDFARFLLADDPLRIHERGPHDFAVLWYAAIGGGSVEAAELLLEAGAPVDQESLGVTCLHWAAMRGQLDLVSCLAERGADLERVGYKFDRAGQTPLALARAKGRDEAVRRLQDLGARA